MLNLSWQLFWKNHVINTYHFELYTDQEVRTSEELRKRYTTALQGKNKVQVILDNLNSSLLKAEDAVISKAHEVQRALQHLDKIALITQVEHL